MKKRDKDRAEVPSSLGPFSAPASFNPTQFVSKPAVFANETTTSLTHSGPLPHPSILAQYEEIMPGLAERIVRMAEGQFEHRLSQEKSAQNAEISIANKTSLYVITGQVFSLVISLVAICAGAYVAVHGQPWVATAFGTGGFAGLVNGILQSRKKDPLSFPAGASVAPPTSIKP